MNITLNDMLKARHVNKGSSSQAEWNPHCTGMGCRRDCVGKSSFESGDMVRLRA